jgi:hypothetical protein
MEKTNTYSHFYTTADVIPSSPTPVLEPRHDSTSEMCSLMREMLAAQDRQNELLEELVVQVGAGNRQRVSELTLWQQANPELAKFCRRAADKLSKVQTEYLATITDEIEYSFENLRDGEFMLTEFVDRFGPRFAHLNGLLHVLSQLGSHIPVATTTDAASRSTK